MDGGGGGDGGGFDHGHDHGDHGHDHGDHGHDMGGHPDQSPIWSQAMQGLKLNDFISSIRITPNHLLLFMFAAFTGWLGVIYWIRHHEPLANYAVGSGPAYTPNAHVDRLLINGARDALPVKTTAGSGLVYTPGSNNAALAPAPMPSYGPGVRFSAPRQNLAVQSGSLNAPASALNGMPGSYPSAMGPAPASNGFGHNARLFSNRDMVGPGGHTGIRGQLPARMVGREMGQAQSSEQFAASPQSAPPAPPPGWSLAKDGFSSDSAHFDSRFGTPGRE